MNPGELYWADLGSGRRPVLVVSRNEFNRGTYVTVALLTTANFDVRSQLPNCVPVRAGEFGIIRDCVIQCETITLLNQSDVDIDAGAIGIIDDERLRTVILAIGHVLDANCEPN